MNNRILSIIVGISLAIVLGVGGIFAISAGIRSIKAVVKYGSITADEEIVNYLCAYYKSLYLDELKAENIDASDTEQFWSSAAEGGVSYGEHFKESLRDYIASVVAAANVYITYSRYTNDDKIFVTMTCEQLLKDKADGDVSVFNAEAKKYGFNYNDFHNAAALLYKAQRAEEILLSNNINLEQLKSEVNFKDAYENIEALAIPALEKYYVEELLAPEK